MRLAKDIYPNGMTAGNELLEDIDFIIKKYRVNNVVETGTYLGEGTSRAIILSQMKHIGNYFNFNSIEVNQRYYEIAKKNIRSIMPVEAYINSITLYNGLSIPVHLLPEEIDNDFPDSVITDHRNADDYKMECNNYVSSDCLKRALFNMNFMPDMVMLDSAGHLGAIEYNYMQTLIPAHHSFILILDDTLHRKHYKTMELIRGDKRCTILKESHNKFGHCLIKYN